MTKKFQATIEYEIDDDDGFTNNEEKQFLTEYLIQMPTLKDVTIISFKRV